MSSRPETSSEESHSEIAARIRAYGETRFSGGYRRIVFTNGCFDVLHPGHLAVFQHCREIAGPFGAVVIGINNDAGVRRLKGEDRPIFDQDSRALLLVSLKNVDHVVTFEEDTPLELIAALRPDVIVKGGNYSADAVVGKELALVSIVPMVAGLSTTGIIGRIRKP